jgi:uncharacterized phage protein (TIGR01671 family)
MRDIEFRGKRKDNGAWETGGVTAYCGSDMEDKCEIIDKRTGYHTPVVPETVGEFTGLFDSKGVKIFEGDILRNLPKNDWEKESYVAFEVFYHDNDCCDRHIGWQCNRLHFHGNIGGYSMSEDFLPKYTEKMVVIGNIHDNPELLEAAK